MSYKFYNNFPYSETIFPTMLDNKDPVNHVYFTGLHTELKDIEDIIKNIDERLRILEGE